MEMSVSLETPAVARIQGALAAQGIDACLIGMAINQLHALGRIWMGFLYVPVEGSPLAFVKRPNDWRGEGIIHFRRPEDIPALIMAGGQALPRLVALEDDDLPWSERHRLAACFPDATFANGSRLLRHLRAVKLPAEIAVMREGALRHAAVVERFHTLWKRGMTDREFANAMNYEVLKAGSLGLFRVAGRSMDVFMGSVLGGDNAAAPSPFDFALGGRGLDPSIPVGADGTALTAGMTVMADVSYNFRGYLTDLSRTLSIGDIPEEAHRLHALAIAIEDRIAALGKPGAACEALYEEALRMAAEAGAADCFMGLAQKAKFIGHGTGLVINELPVIGVRSKEVLEEGMVIALEPKFIVPGVGAVGVEDTFLVTSGGMERLTLCDRAIKKIEE